MVKQYRKGPVELFSTGSTLLNLVCSDKAAGAFSPGTMVNIIGDSESGKTLLALTVLAEAANNSRFDKHLLIYDDVEAALGFDIQGLFGTKLSKRIKGPNGVVSKSRSNRIEEYYYSLDDLLDKGDPFVYVIDSADALTSKHGEAKFKESKKAHRDGKEVAGNYGLEKPKIHSEWIPLVVGRLCDTKSLLIVVSQTRDNIGMSFAPKTRSGGRALKFYAFHEMWLAKKKGLSKTVRKIKRETGIQAMVKVSKNKATGRSGKVEFPILYSYGLDNITSCAEYLVSEGVWKKGSVLSTGTFGFKGKITGLPDYVNENDKHKELADLCETTWKQAIEDASVKWEKRYE